ncbi:MAG: hypothetical protein QJR02_10260 [Sinobacteraceae bacterium]|nr:hypothetical protein [Nevskiaceae bacterium]
MRKYEAGRLTPDAERIALICEREGISADWLLFGRGEPRPSSAQAEARETPPPYVPEPAGDGSFSERAAHELVRRLDHARPLVDRLMEVYGFQRAPMLHAALCLLASIDGVGVKELALLVQAIKDYAEKTKQEGKP